MIFNLTTPAVSKLPKFTYTGTYTLLDDGGGNWRIKFLSSGKFTPAKDMTVDVFIVGGGGGGGSGTSGMRFVSGGGGGYTKTVTSQLLKAGVAYDVVVGAGGAVDTSGGASTFNGVSANGGQPGESNITGAVGGSGGSGGGSAGKNSADPSILAGNGGSDGSDGGAIGSMEGGTGQGTTTREFGEASGDLYAGGGGGQGNYRYYYISSGGDGGGGHGRQNGTANTGGGGGGNFTDTGSDGNGGSGIVIIRNARG